ncbi:MAG: 23S rRNA (uracil(1939)-C(5))-methyltransferase RlmD [Bacillota bacterium]
MKKNDVIELKIEGVSFPNRGYGFIDGQKVVVKNAIPKEVISARIIKKRSSGIEARKEALLAESPLARKSDFCSHYALCGGCNYQILERDAELTLKELQVKELFEKNNIPVLSWEGIVPAPLETGYRNKCEFSFGDEEKDGDLALGMRKRMSMYEVVSLKDCNIIDADFLKIVEGSLAFFQKENVPFYHKMRHDGSLRHLVVRKGEATGEILVHLVTSSEVPFSPEQYKDVLLELQLENEIIGILHSINDGVADVVKSDEMTTLYGRSWFVDKLFGDLEFQITPYSFFQTNTSGAEKLYGIVREFAGDVSEKTVFDLYCGTGTIGQVMAKAGSKEVIGIELVEEAIVAAKENTKRNHLENCRFIAGDVQTEVEKLEDVPELIIVDPPRDGMHKKAVERIIDFGAKEILYVSCKPTSLVRDLEAFLEAGYVVERVKLMDMFPRTVHVETVVRLTR